jgi:hypothetical protein
MIDYAGSIAPQSESAGSAGAIRRVVISRRVATLEMVETM